MPFLLMVPVGLRLPAVDFSDHGAWLIALAAGLILVALVSFCGAFRTKRPGLVWLGIICLFLPIFLYVGRENLAPGRMLDFSSISYIRLFRGIGPSIMAVIFLKALFHR